MRTICAAIAVGLLAPAIMISAARAETASDYTIGSGETHYVTPTAPLHARFNVLPPKDMTPDRMRALIAAPAVASEPYWQTTFKDQKTGVVYGTGNNAIFLLGLNPALKASNRAVVAKVTVIPLIITIGKTVFDPTKIDTACEPKASALTLLSKSPLVQDFTLTVDGTKIGTGQYPSLFQRGNFYKFIKSVTPKYNLVLKYNATAALKVTVKGGALFNAPCKKIGVMDQATFDNFALGVIKANPSLLPPDTFPFFLLYNVVMDENNDPNNCCILGFHSAFSNPKFGGAFQAYGVGDFDSSHGFGSGVSDISALSHEVNEWQDDPTAGNRTPPWGHIGQVGACQGNLEVGDPLSGNIKPITMNGFTYHVQDLAFVSWFYETNPSIGSNRWYSLFGSEVKTTSGKNFSFKTQFAIEPCR